MMKKLALCSLFLASSLFATQQQTSDEEMCTDALIMLKGLEAWYLPADKDSCEHDSDCTWLQEESWKRPSGINKATSDAYDSMRADIRYFKNKNIKDAKCMLMHPMVIWPAPTGVLCNANRKCRVIMEN